MDEAIKGSGLLPMFFRLERSVPMYLLREKIYTGKLVWLFVEKMCLFLMRFPCFIRDFLLLWQGSNSQALNFSFVSYGTGTLPSTFVAFSSVYIRFSARVLLNCSSVWTVLCLDYQLPGQPAVPAMEPLRRRLFAGRRSSGNLRRLRQVPRLTCSSGDLRRLRQVGWHALQATYGVFDR